MPTVFEKEIERLRTSAKQTLVALNARRDTTQLCIRQDREQQRLIERLKVRYRQLKSLDLEHAFEHERNLAWLESEVQHERPELKLVA